MNRAEQRSHSDFNVLWRDRGFASILRKDCEQALCKRWWPQNLILCVWERSSVFAHYWSLHSSWRCGPPSNIIPLHPKWIILKVLNIICGRAGLLEINLSASSVWECLYFAFTVDEKFAINCSFVMCPFLPAFTIASWVFSSWLGEVFLVFIFLGVELPCSVGNVFISFGAFLAIISSNIFSPYFFPPCVWMFIGYIPIDQEALFYSHHPSKRSSLGGCFWQSHPQAYCPLLCSASGSSHEFCFCDNLFFISSIFLFLFL